MKNYKNITHLILEPDVALSRLNKIGECKVTMGNNGFLCKHEDGMIKSGNNIIAYLCYFNSEEEAITDYFLFLIQPGITILLRDSTGLCEFQYDGTEFIKINIL